MLTVQQKPEGEVVYNEGDFAVTEIGGVESEDAGVFLTTLQAYR
jgi:hypothetical protein